jgi:hypothetical protein
MSEGQSQRSVILSVQHRQEAEVTAAEGRERAAAETVATAAKAARLTMAELAAAGAEVEAAAAADAACAAVVELETLRASSTSSSVSTDDDRDNELKLTREAAREQVAQWAAVHQQGCHGGGASGGVHTVAVSLMAGLTEIAAFTGGAALPPRIGTMVTMGSRPLSGTSVPTAGRLPSPRPTTSSGPR